MRTKTYSGKPLSMHPSAVRSRQVREDEKARKYGEESRRVDLRSIRSGYRGDAPDTQETIRQISLQIEHE